MFHRILASSRFIVIIAVIGSFLASLASLIYGAIETVVVIVKILAAEISSETIKAISVSFIEVIDLFLIGTVFLIISLGLYELFIDDRLELPGWLIVTSLDDLKEKLISGVVVVMGVYFLGVLVDWKGGADLLPLSAAIAVMIVALTFFQYVNARNH